MTNNGHDTQWTEERVQIVREMTEAGEGSGAIARVLGCTRNAIIGIRKRKGIQSKLQRKWTRKRVQGIGRAERPLVGSSVPASIDSEPANCAIVGLPTLDLGRNECRYVVNSEPPFMHCAAPGFPWCEQHRRIVWRKAGSIEA